MSQTHIEIKKLRVANWQGSDVRIEKNKWTAITGPSGSGKTSLLFGGLQAWSTRQFELLNNPAAIVSNFNNSNIADDITGLTPVLASAGEIPRRRRQTKLIDMLHLHPLLQSWWQQLGSFCCANCNHSWQPFSSAAVIDDLSNRVNGNQVVMILSRTSAEMPTDELLMQGLTRYYLDGTLHRIEDVGDTLAAGSWLLHDRFKGLTNHLQRAAEGLNAAHSLEARVAVVVEDDFAEYQVDNYCAECHLSHDSSNLRLRLLGDNNWHDLLGAPLSAWGKLLDNQDKSAAARLVRFAIECGLHHLQVDRQLATLSLGEARRIELLTWISQSRSGQTLVFDEPGIGLHGHERVKVASLFRKLVAAGNTVITADPCYEFLAAADSCIVVGPGAGKDGGTICGTGSLDSLSITAPSGFASAQLIDYKEIIFEKLAARHLNIPKLVFPMGCIVAVCGVSGSGKSTLFAEELWPRLKDLQKTHPFLSRGSVHSLLQRSLSVAARSTLATLAGCMSELRDLFAATPHAKQRGFSASDFVASPKRGACAQCKGLAVDHYAAICNGCDGLALRDELLDIRYRGAAMREWLTLPLNELNTLLPRKGKLRKCVDLLIKLGLGDRRLGERAKVFSFGERSRIALAKRLSLIKEGLAKLFLIDEACLGLPDNEAHNFMNVLNDFCADGHSFWLIEHHHIVLRNAHHLIEIGPHAGERGGQVVYCGHPSGLQECDTATARWLTSEIEPSAPTDAVHADNPSFEVFADGVEREGYQVIRGELSTELRMRSVLNHNQFEDRASNSLLKRPVAWPVMVASRTTLLNCLGLDDYISNLVQQHGELCCSGCGGAGPYHSLTEFVEQLNVEQTITLACPMPQLIQKHPQRETWLAAAGYRNIIDDKYIELDRFEVSKVASELPERCSDVFQQLQKLEQDSVFVFVDSQQLMNVSLSACRDCQHVVPLEHRFDNHPLAELRAAKISDAIKLLANRIDDSLLVEALRLLGPTSLFNKAADCTVQSLTSVEQRSARLIGILLFAPKDLCLLFDNVFAGFPSNFGRFLATACQQSSLLMHHADAAGYFADPPQTLENMGSSLSQPQSFTAPYSFGAFDPAATSSSATLSEALQLVENLAEFYSRCDSARLRGIKSKDLILASSPYKCTVCKGQRGERLHPAFLSTCAHCQGTGFDSTLSSLIERGLSFTQALQLPLHELAQALRGTKIARILDVAVDCGLGDYCLAAQIAQMARSTRSLAPLIHRLAASDKDLQIHNIFDGLNTLQVKPLCITIQGLVAHRSLLEWRENHPQFET